MLKPGYVYPLITRDRFDDEYGKDFDHVAVPEGAGGPWIIADVWPCKANGEIHPGYDACPVPVHCEDVNVEGGNPLGFKLPKARSMMEAFWH